MRGEEAASSSRLLEFWSRISSDYLSWSRISSDYLHLASCAVDETNTRASGYFHPPRQAARLP